MKLQDPQLSRYFESFSNSLEKLETFLRTIFVQHSEVHFFISYQVTYRLVSASQY